MDDQRDPQAQDDATGPAQDAGTRPTPPETPPPLPYAGGQPFAPGAYPATFAGANDPTYPGTLTPLDPPTPDASPPPGGFPPPPAYLRWSARRGTRSRTGAGACTCVLPAAGSGAGSRIRAARRPTSGRGRHSGSLTAAAQEYDAPSGRGDSRLFRHLWRGLDHGWQTWNRHDPAHPERLLADFRSHRHSAYIRFGNIFLWAGQSRLPHHLGVSAARGDAAELGARPPAAPAPVGQRSDA